MQLTFLQRLGCVPVQSQAHERLALAQEGLDEAARGLQVPARGRGTWAPGDEEVQRLEVHEAHRLQFHQALLHA